MRLWPLKGTLDSSSLRFCCQHGDAQGVRLSAPNIRKIIMISLYTFVSSCSGGLWWVSVSMGVIRRVELTSRLMRREFSGRDRGEPRRGPSLTTSTISIITITTRTRCSGEMLLPVKQQKGPCSPTMCRCVRLCRGGGAVYMCTYAYMCLHASCCLHNSLPLTAHSFPFTSPLHPPLLHFPLYHSIYSWISCLSWKLMHENRGWEGREKGKKNNRKKINRGECWWGFCLVWVQRCRGSLVLKGHMWEDPDSISLFISFHSLFPSIHTSAAFHHFFL